MSAILRTRFEENGQFYKASDSRKKIILGNLGEEFLKHLLPLGCAFYGTYVGTTVGRTPNSKEE